MTISQVSQRHVNKWSILGTNLQRNWCWYEKKDGRKFHESIQINTSKL